MGASSGSSGLDTNYALVFADDTTTPEMALDLVSMDSDGFTLTKDVGGTKQAAVIYLALRGISVARGTLTQPTTTGNQSITGLGFRPAVVLFDGGDKATADGFEQDAEMVAGIAASSTKRASFWIGSVSYSSPYPSDTDLSTTSVIRSLTPGTPTLDAAADFVSWDSDGFTIDWTTVDSTQRKIGWVALGPPSGVKFGTFTANSGTGSQSVTGLGFQPKAVLFWITDLTSAGSGSYARFGRGWTDGTNQGAVATAWDDSSGVSNSRDRIVNTKCITLIDHSGAILAEAGIVSFDSDGFTINWSTAGGSRLVTYLALGGDALTNVKVGGFIYPTTTSYSETGLGFQPEVVLFMGVESATAFGNTTRGGHGFGVAISSTNRHSDAHRWRDGKVGASSGSSGLDTNYALVFADDTTTPEMALDLVSMDSDGFTLTKDVGGTKQAAVIYLALRGISVARGTLTQPTTTGNQSITGLGFRPAVVLFDGGDKATADGFEQDAEMVAGIAASSTKRASFWIGSVSYSSPYPSDTDLSTTSVIRSLTPGTPTLDAAADFVSWDSDGFTIDWTTVDSTQRKIGWVALGPPSGATFVELIGFEAIGLDRRVKLEWETATELDNEGFNLLRSDMKDGKYVRINPYFIPSKGEAGLGAQYSYTDYYVENGITYYYIIEDIDIYGKRTLHGPVSATPNDIILIFPVEGDSISLNSLFFSWKSSRFHYFKVDISPNASFPYSETLSFPLRGWTVNQSLWLKQKQKMMILRKARAKSKQLFWRVRAKTEKCRIVYSRSKKFVIEILSSPEINLRKKSPVRSKK
ncbi:MAG: hypothetical protein ACE5LC_02155 [Candidatus Aminicenantales bacterium]